MLCGIPSISAFTGQYEEKNITCNVVIEINSCFPCARPNFTWNLWHSDTLGISPCHSLTFKTFEWPNQGEGSRKGLRVATWYFSNMHTRGGPNQKTHMEEVFRGTHMDEVFRGNQHYSFAMEYVSTLKTPLSKVNLENHMEISSKSKFCKMVTTTIYVK